VDWIHLNHDRLQWRAVVNTVISPWVPLLKAMNCLTNLQANIFSRCALLHVVKSVRNV
jgi:hypothetical protein